jgi:TRAP-type mannitol/chloroaromatic compound transport system permease small subunit
VTSSPSAGAAGNQPRRPLPASGLARLFAWIDRINYGVGTAWALTVILITAAVVYEVVVRTAFGRPTVWSNEVTIYVSACAYLVAGGYALLYRQHVRIDVLYLALAPVNQRRLDVATFVFFAAYCLTLIVVGGQLALTSFGQSETTGTPWNPPIWPVKAMIPVSGLLLLLQGIANLMRDLGFGTTDDRAP